ncbi:MAG: hypothetical protein ACO29O_05300 [Chitinophagaceae bacterium]
MKHYLLIIVLFSPIILFAQHIPTKEGRLQSLEIAYLTKELNLSPDEAKTFWPIYNKYSVEIKDSWKENKEDDLLSKQQRVLDIRKKYKGEFSKVISHDRVDQLYNAEVRFREMVRREFALRQQNQGRMRLNQKMR